MYYFIYCFFKVIFEFMLPDPKDVPAISFIIFSDLLIPLNISIQFFLPKTDICFWDISMYWAMMPKTGVDKNNNSIFFNGKIRCPVHIFRVPSVSNTPMPHSSADFILQFGNPFNR